MSLEEEYKWFIGEENNDNQRGGEFDIFKNLRSYVQNNGGLIKM